MENHSNAVPPAPSQSLAWLLFALLVPVGIGGGLFYFHKQNHQTTLLAVMRELPEALAQDSTTFPIREPEEWRASTVATLEGRHGLSPWAADRDLPAFADQWITRSEATPLDRALAAWVKGKYKEAETLGLALKPGPDKLKALLLAADAARAQKHNDDALDHLTAAAALADAKSDPVAWAGTQWAVALGLDAAGRRVDALPIARKAVEALKNSLGPQHPQTLRCRVMVADIMAHNRQRQEAETEYRAVARLQEQVLGPKHMDTLRSLCWAAVTQIWRTVPDKAKLTATAFPELDAVSLRQERALGPTHYDTLTGRAALAEGWLAGGRGTEVVREYNAVMTLFIRELGETHPCSLEALRALGKAESQQNDIHAEGDYLKLVTLWTKATGASSEPTLTARSSYASLLGLRGKHKDAALQYRLVADARLRNKGKEDPETLRARNMQGKELEEAGEHAEAEALHRDVLAIREKVLGANSEETHITQFNLSVALSSQKQYDEAEKLLRAVAKARDLALGPKHASTLLTHNQLAYVLSRTERPEEAETEYQKVLDVQTQLYGAQGVETLKTLLNLAYVQSLQKHYDVAEKAFRAVIAGREKTLGAEHYDTITAKFRLISCLERSEQWEVAGTELRPLLAYYERTSGTEHRYTVALRSRLAECLDKQGNRSEALSYAMHARAGWKTVKDPSKADQGHIQAMDEIVKRLKN